MEVGWGGGGDKTPIDPQWYTPGEKRTKIWELKKML